MEPKDATARDARKNAAWTRTAFITALSIATSSSAWGLTITPAGPKTWEFSLLPGESIVLEKGVTLEAKAAGTTHLIGPGANIISWTFQPFDTWIVNDYQAVKNPPGSGAILNFRVLNDDRYDHQRAPVPADPAGYHPPVPPIPTPQGN